MPAETAGPAVHVDALRWVDGQPRLETRTAAGTAAAARLVRSLDADPAVSDAQVRTRYQLTPTGTTGLPARRLLATDPYLRYAYHLSTVDAYAAWPTTRGAGVKVAVLDSGVDDTQPDLVGACSRSATSRPSPTPSSSTTAPRSPPSSPAPTATGWAPRASPRT